MLTFLVEYWFLPLCWMPSVNVKETGSRISALQQSSSNEAFLFAHYEQYASMCWFIIWVLEHMRGKKKEIWMQYVETRLNGIGNIFSLFVIVYWLCCVLYLSFGPIFMLMQKKKYCIIDIFMFLFENGARFFHAC